MKSEKVRIEITPLSYTVTVYSRGCKVGQTVSVMKNSYLSTDIGPELSEQLPNDEKLAELIEGSQHHLFRIAAELRRSVYDIRTPGHEETEDIEFIQ